MLLEANVREWYQSTFPEDDLGSSINSELSFSSLYQQLGYEDIYNILGVGDSVVRERIFSELAIREDEDYDHIYNLAFEKPPVSVYNKELYSIENGILKFEGYFNANEELEMIQYSVTVPVGDWSEINVNRDKAEEYLKSLTDGVTQTKECFEDERSFLKRAEDVVVGRKELPLEKISKDTLPGKYIDSRPVQREKQNSENARVEDPAESFQTKKRDLLKLPDDSKKITADDAGRCLINALETMYPELYDKMDYVIMPHDANYLLQSNHDYFRASIVTGGNEGVYVDLDLYDSKSKCMKSCVVAKTLDDGIEGYQAIGQLAGVLTSFGDDFLWYNYDVIEKQTDRSIDSRGS